MHKGHSGSRTVQLYLHYGCGFPCFSFELLTSLRTSFLTGDRKYVPLGCYRDKTDDRTLPILINNLRKAINWTDMSLTIDKCADLTTARNLKFQVFSLQFYGECFSGYDGLKTYDKHGALPYSDKITQYCWAGVGGPGINFVYKFTN